MCFVEDTDGDLQYVVFVDGIGYPTCVAALLSSNPDCPSDKYLCMPNNWPNPAANYFLAGQVYGEFVRNNHQHNRCPTIQDICIPTRDPGGLTNFHERDLQPLDMAGQFDNNICVGVAGGVRVVTSEGFQPTCVGFRWNEAGDAQMELCQTERNFFCGSLQDSLGRQTVGWYGAQVELVRNALRQEDYRMPECPYNCREC